MTTDIPIGIASPNLINSKQLELLLRIGYLCNNAKLDNGKIIGDPTYTWRKGKRGQSKTIIKVLGQSLVS